MTNIIADMRELAGGMRDLLGLMVYYYNNPEDVAKIEAEIERIDLEFLTLPWEDQQFTFKEVVK